MVTSLQLNLMINICTENGSTLNQPIVLPKVDKAANVLNSLVGFCQLLNVVK